MRRKEEKGSVTLFVLISCMFMVVILLVVNIGVMNKNRSQEKNLEEIAKQYSQNETDLDNIYEEKVEDEGYMKKAEVEELINNKMNELEFYKPGDEIYLGNVSTAGYVIDNAGDYRFEIYLDKKIAKEVTSIEASCVGVAVMQNKNYLLGKTNEIAKSGFELKFQEGWHESPTNAVPLIITVDKASTYAINRNPCGIYINRLTLKFS